MSDVSVSISETVGGQSQHIRASAPTVEEAVRALRLASLVAHEMGVSNVSSE